MKRVAFLAGFVVLVAFLLVGCSEGSKESPVGGDSDVVEGEQEGDVETQCVYAEDCGEGQDCRNGVCVHANVCLLGNKDCAPDEVCDKRPWDEKGYCRKACSTDLDCPADGQCLNGVCERYQPLPEGTEYKDGTEPKQPLVGALAVVPLDFPIGVTMGGYGTRRGVRSPYADKMGGSNGMYDRPYVKALLLDNGTDAVIFVRVPLIFPTDFLVTGVVKKVIEETGYNITRNLVITGTHTHSMPARFWNILPGMGFGALGMDEFSWEIYQRLVNSIASAVIQVIESDKIPVAVGYGFDNNFDPDDLVSSDRRKENNPIDGGPYKDPRLFMLRVDDVSEQDSPKPLAVIISFAAHGTINDVTDTWITQDTGGGVELVFQEYFEKETGNRIEAMFMQGMAGDVSPRGNHLGHKHQQQMYMLGHYLYPKAKALYDSIGTTRDVELEVVTKRIPIDRQHIGYTDSEFYAVDLLAKGCEVLGLSGEACESASRDELKDAACRALEEETGMPYEYCSDICLSETEPFGPLRFGGFQCGLISTEEDDDINTRMWDGCLGCMLKVESMNMGPMPQFSKTRLSALRLNKLVLAILPGEPMSKMGAEYVNLIVDDARNATGEDYDAVILGYSNDHHFYLLLEDDWYQGGYEATMSIWGPKFGAYLLDEGRKLVAQLFTPEREDNSNNIKPLNYKDSYIDKALEVNGLTRWRTPVPTNQADITIVEQPPSQYKRQTQFRIHWIGGDPGVDLPRVVLQKKKNESGEFEDVLTPSGRVYDDSGYSMMLEWENPCLNSRNYSRCEGGDEDVNHWYLTFEERYNLPSGVYRLKIIGHYYTGEKSAEFDASKVEQYELYTDEFEVMPVEIQLFDAALDDSTLKFTVFAAYPPGPTTDPGAPEPFDELKSTGLLVHCTETPPVLGCKVAPDEIEDLTLQLVPVNGGDTIEFPKSELNVSVVQHLRRAVVSRDADGNEQLHEYGEYPTTAIEADLSSVPSGDYTLQILLRDTFGNEGTLQQGITIP